MSKFDRVSIPKDCRETYAMIKEHGPLKGKQNKEIFALAMALGIKKGHRVPYGSKAKDGFFNLKDLNEKDFSFFYAIAISEEGKLDVLSDISKVFLIAEEYANGGIHLLKQELFEKNDADFVKRLETLLRSELEKYIKK